MKSAEELLGENYQREILSWAALIVFLLPFVLYALPQLVGAQDALVVRSGSMEPDVPTGSVIWIYNSDPSTVENGTVITFRTGTDPRTGEPQLTTHRIIEVLSRDPPEFRTKGDNNEDPDPRPVQGDEIVGQLGFTVPFLGYAIAWAGTPQAFVILVIIPAAILILNELANIVSEVAGMKELGEEMQLLRTAIVVTSALAIVATAVYFTQFGEQLFSGTSGFSLGPTAFGIVMIAAMVVSMIALRFIDI